MRKILKGEITNWSAAGGIDLPIRIVLPPQNIDPFNQFIQMHFEEDYRPPKNSIQTASMDNFYETMAGTSGGVGITAYREAVERDKEILPVERREQRLNLTLRFLFKPPARSGTWGGISGLCGASATGSKLDYLSGWLYIYAVVGWFPEMNPEA